MQRFPLSAVRLNLGLRAPLVFAIGMLTGAVWYYSISFEPPSAWLYAAAILLLSGLIWGMRHLGAGLAVAAMIFAGGAATGAVSGNFASLRAPPATLQAPIGPVLVEGWIIEAQPAKRGVRLMLRVHAIDDLTGSKTPNIVRVTHISALKTEPGRFVRCWSVLRPPPKPVIAGDYDFERQAWYSGLGAVGYVQGRCRGGALGQPDSLLGRVTLRVAKWRRTLAIHVETSAGDRAGGFAAALASGDRSFMEAADQDALRGSGLAHLLAISGLHMGIVGGLVFLILWRTLSIIEAIALRWTVKKPAALGALTACGVYLIVSGASVSTQRAFIMAAIVFGAVILDRTALSLRSLAIAMIAILVLAPWSVLTPGFQMSFAATGALIATYETWQRRRQETPGSQRRGVSFWVKSLIVTSTVSSLATMPFAMFHFGRVAGLGLAANLAAMPIISLISAPLAATALLLAPFGLDGGPLRAFGFSLEGILAIAHYFSRVGSETPVHLPQMPALSLTLFASVIILYGLIKRLLLRAVIGLSLGLLALCIWALSANDRLHWAPSGEVFLEYSNGDVQRIGLLDGDGLAPLRFVNTPKSSACAPQSDCVIPFGNDTVVHLNPNKPSDAQLIERASIILAQLRSSMPDGAGSRPVIYWPDVMIENGITLERRGDRFVKREKPTCGRRPWRVCSTN